MPSLQGIAQDIFSLFRLHDDGVPTASIAVLENGKIDAHILTSGPETTETVYQAASISKAICALAVARLVDEGKVSYDTKVIEVLDAGIVDVIVGDHQRARELMRHVKIQMLLSHTSGLSQHGFPGYAGDDVPSAEQIIAGRFPANTPRMRFNSFPGAQCSYSGGGYVILQLVLEAITGLDFAELMQQTVLRPLSMSRSWYGDLPPHENDCARAYFTAHTPAAAKRGYHIQPELAAAALWTTPSDLLRAVSAIQESLYTESGYLKQQTAKLLLMQAGMTRGVAIVGLGWWVNDIGFGHAGDNEPGYAAYLMGFRGDAEQPHNGIAVMTNSALGHEMCVGQILAGIMYARGWRGSVRKSDLWLPSVSDEFVPYPAPTTTGVGETWKIWKGKWEGGWEIVEQDDRPALQYGDFTSMPLKPAAGPVKTFGGGKQEVRLVVEGLRIGVRLTWEDGGQGGEIVRLQMEAERVLKRAD